MVAPASACCSPMGERYDAVIVGSGPNGLAAAVRLADAGCAVHVVEADETVGGGTRSSELTLPGYVHDVCSAIHPLGVGSPYLSGLPLEEHGLEWVHPDLPLAHPLDAASAVVLERSPRATGDHLDAEDRAAWGRVFAPLVRDWPTVRHALLGELLRVPRHPVRLARFGLQALLPATGLARLRFRGERARALFAGLAAHSFLSLRRPTSAAFGLVLAIAAHAVGWPMARGGSQSIADALAGHLGALGGTVRTGQRVTRIDELPPARAVVLDVTPHQALAIAGDRLPARVRRSLAGYRRGPGVFKVDYALREPAPWSDPAVRGAGTVHLGGTIAEIAAAESSVAAGRHPDRPYVLVAQQSIADPSRAPDGRHTLWAYCHVPNGSTVDMTTAIEGQLERFAPGFRDVVLARHAMGPAEVEARNPNNLGGDISAGAHDGLQLIARPRLSLDPYRLAPPEDAHPGVYLCSAATPPGAGVHGMCGYHAASSVLEDLAGDALT